MPRRSKVKFTTNSNVFSDILSHYQNEVKFRVVFRMRRLLTRAIVFPLRHDSLAQKWLIYVLHKHHIKYRIACTRLLNNITALRTLNYWFFFYIYKMSIYGIKDRFQSRRNFRDVFLESRLLHDTVLKYLHGNRVDFFLDFWFSHVWKINNIGRIENRREKKVTNPWK